MKILLIFCIFLATFPLYSQYNQANIWYLENGNGIDFNQNPPKPVNNHVFWLGRLSTICDEKGQLLFYTDGTSVIDKNHKIMKNGAKLLGHTESIIVPYPKKKNLYYIFSISTYDSLQSKFGRTTFEQDTSGSKPVNIYDWIERDRQINTYNHRTSRLYYHIVDMSKNSGLGEIIEKNKLVYKPLKADLVVARHANNKDYWLITHEFLTNKFKIFLINEKGLQEKPIETAIGMKLYDNRAFHINFYVGHSKTNSMSISANFEKIAIYDLEHKQIQVFDFDNETGKIIKFKAILAENYKEYGSLSSLELSPNGEKIFILYTRIDAIYNIKKKENFKILFQYDISDENYAIKNVKKKIYYYSSKKSPFDEIIDEDLRTAPNGKMYFLKYAGAIGIIENPNDDLDSIKINYCALKYDVNVGYSLPYVAHLLPPFYPPIKSGDTFQREILFETGKYDLKEYHYPILGDIVQFLKENPKTNIIISGHTDNEGNPQANKTLSENRAKSVKNYLISQQINPNRITSQGFGDTKPLLDNFTPENKRKNRRIEFLVE